MTTDHVVSNADQMEVITADGQQRTAQIAWRSPARDLVFLQVDLSLPPVDLEPATQQLADEAVVVVGYRATSPGHANLTANYGQVSAVRQDQEGITYLQTEALMDPGMSGGPVVNSRGQVVGVSSTTDQSSGRTFAVGGEEVQAMLVQPPRRRPRI